jgi:transposase
LAPTLAPGEVVILDNLGSHKGKPARNAIRARGAHLLFLPPYSPDLNPIEQVFAKPKKKARAVSGDPWLEPAALHPLARPDCPNFAIGPF